MYVQSIQYLAPSILRQTVMHINKQLLAQYHKKNLNPFFGLYLCFWNISLQFLYLRMIFIYQLYNALRFIQVLQKHPQPQVAV